MLDVGCGSGVLSIAAAKLGFDPVIARRLRPAGRRGDPARTRPRTASSSTSRYADLREDELPTAALALANIAADAVVALGPRLRTARAITSGYLVSDEPELEGYRRERRVQSGGWAADLHRASSSLSRSMASFSVRFLGCKVSQTDAQALRERLVRDGHTEVDGAGDVAVVNTCCVTNEGLAKSRQAAARAARSHGRVYVTGCGARLSGSAFAGLPDNVTVVPGQIEEAVETVAGDVGAIGVRPGRCAARPRARIREDPGRLLVLVRVLRDPARPRRARAAAAPTPCSARSAGGSPRATARSSSPASISAASATAPPG